MKLELFKPISLSKFINKSRDFFLSEYRKGFLYIISSKILIAFVAFLTTPILSRLYRPEEYGYFGLINSVILIASLVSNLTLPTGLLTAKEGDVQKSVSGILGYSVLMNLFFLLAGGIVLFFRQDLSLPVSIVALMCFSSFLTTATQIFANLNIRDKLFKKNVAVNLIDNFSARGSSLTFGLVGFTGYGLFVGETIGKMANLGRQLWAKNKDSYAFKVSFNFSRIQHVIVSNKNYPLFNLPTILIGSFSGQLILWILALDFSTATVGYFNMAIGLLSIPLALLANSLQPLITSKFISGSHSDSRSLFWRATITISILSALFYLTIFLVAPIFVKIYLSQAWVSSVVFIQILCFPFFLQLLGNSMSGLFIVYNKQRANFLFKLFFLAVLISGFFLLLKMDAELKTIVIWYSIIVSLEEIAKISYIALKLDYVRSS